MGHPLTQRANRVVALANDIARRSGIRQGHDLAVLIAILEDNGGIAAAILHDLGLELAFLYRRLFNGPLPADASAGNDIARLLDASEPVVSELGAAEMGTEHMLLAMLRSPETAAGKALSDAGVTEEAVQEAAGRLA